ncbi:MFS transporter [Corynebacterium hansenii]|uniref:MFS transporter n=1 Tax=Corynebacterium hansenii TaxID=394964 RepID=A0ABV7ZRD4_9CORY|nr:MFS transporter [Corynebacterium hansenii]WJZ00529.1 Major Facilitator Superfamily protein [Corynebacterium hansenii]
MQMITTGTRAKLILMLMAGHIIGGFGVGVASGVGAMMVDEFTGSMELARMMGMLPAVGAILAALPLAAVAKARGRAVSLAGGSAVAAAGAFVAVVAGPMESVALVAAGLLLFGTATAVALQSRFAAADAASPRHRGLMLSLVMTPMIIGSAFGPDLMDWAGEISEGWGLPQFAAPFLLAVAAQMLAGLVYFAGLRPDPLAVARASEGDWAVHGAVPNWTGPVHPHGAAPNLYGPAPLRRRSPGVLRAQVAIAVAEFVLVIIMVLASMHMIYAGVPSELLTLAVTLRFAAPWVSSPLFGWLADILGPRPVILGGQALFVLAIAAIVVFPEDGTVLTAAHLLLGLGWSATVVAASTVIANADSAETRPMVQGRTDLGMNLASLGAGFIAMVLFEEDILLPLAFVMLLPVAVVVGTHLSRGRAVAG